MGTERLAHAMVEREGGKCLVVAASTERKSRKVGLVMALVDREGGKQAVEVVSDKSKGTESSRLAKITFLQTH